MKKSNVTVRRIYDEAVGGETRVLVDRLWPRGVAKADAGLDEWCKDIAPSDQLRRWYGHDPEKFDEFKRRYLEELRQPERVEAVDRLKRAATEGRLGLLTATRDVEISAATVLAEVLKG